VSEKNQQVPHKYGGGKDEPLALYQFAGRPARRLSTLTGDILQCIRTITAMIAAIIAAPATRSMGTLKGLLNQGREIPLRVRARSSVNNWVSILRCSSVRTHRNASAAASFPFCTMRNLKLSFAKVK
jgi:hypothetical protein